MWSYNYSGELYHFGIKGMKWGVRRYQNYDGTLTPAGKKRISKQYRKAAEATTRDLNRNSGRMYMETYNKAADYMNRGGADRFNEQQRKKYGENYAERKGYLDDYENEFNNKFVEFANQTLSDFYKSNKNYQESKRLVDEYGMTKWDDLAKSNEAKIEELRRAVEGR